VLHCYARKKIALFLFSVEFASFYFARWGHSWFNNFGTRQNLWYLTFEKFKYHKFYFVRKRKILQILLRTKIKIKKILLRTKKVKYHKLCLIPELLNQGFVVALQSGLTQFMPCTEYLNFSYYAEFVISKCFVQGRSCDIFLFRTRKNLRYLNFRTILVNYFYSMSSIIFEYNVGPILHLNASPSLWYIKI
jgi:hypothetical protein